jgi:hypothetical protein
MKRWIYAGHVGTGFDQAALKSLYGTMQPLRTHKKPFDQKVKDEKATTWLCGLVTGWCLRRDLRQRRFLVHGGDGAVKLDPRPASQNRKVQGRLRKPPSDPRRAPGSEDQYATMRAAENNV